MIATSFVTCGSDKLRFCDCRGSHIGVAWSVLQAVKFIYCSALYNWNQQNNYYYGKFSDNLMFGWEGNLKIIKKFLIKVLDNIEMFSKNEFWCSDVLVSNLLLDVFLEQVGNLEIKIPKINSQIYFSQCLECWYR